MISCATFFPLNSIVFCLISRFSWINNIIGEKHTMLTAVQTEYPIGKQNQLLLSEIRQQLFVLTFEAERKRLADNMGIG